MPTDPQAFFAEQQGAAVLKHGLIRRYPRVFASKTGKWATNHRVVLVDGYAGAGVYEDGSVGSPVLAADTASALSATRNVVGVYVEKDDEMFTRLEKVMAAHPDHEAHVLNGSVEDKLDEILALAGTSPSFFFFDPFGLGIPFDLLTGNVLARSQRQGAFRSGPATEVLLNFSLSGLRRQAGHLTSRSIDPTYLKARDTIIESLDSWLGGDYWRSMWTRGDDNKLLEITREYCNRLHQAAGGWSYWSVPVSDRWDGPASYVLVFLTQHADGFWLFHEALSGAMEDFYDWCHRGTLDLDPKEEREARWVQHIETNIQRLLTDAPFTVREKMTEVYGTALGVAREKHIRAAIKSLHKAGRTKTDGKGEVGPMRVLP